MTLHDQPTSQDNYEEQPYDPEIEEFTSLINPFVSSKEETREKDNRQDYLPDWPYPDNDYEFDDPKVRKKLGYEEINEEVYQDF